MKTEPVLLEDGTLHNFIVYIEGKDFYCKCGCNVFHKPDRTQLNKYECNSCGLQYENKRRTTHSG